eukprot:6197160-Pleurochrysis_carterae.AAC.5
MKREQRDNYRCMWICERIEDIGLRLQRERRCSAHCHCPVCCPGRATSAHIPARPDGLRLILQWRGRTTWAEMLHGRPACCCGDCVVARVAVMDKDQSHAHDATNWLRAAAGETAMQLLQSTS